MRRNLLKRKIALGLREEKYLETSEQIIELDEPKSGVEETIHQENTTVETIEREAEATTIVVESTTMETANTY